MKPHPTTSSNFITAACATLAFAFVLANLIPAHAQQAAANPVSGKLSDVYAPGDEVTLDGKKLYVKEASAETIVLMPPLPPTAVIGDFITPVSAGGTPGQAGSGREPSATINGSGLRELYPGGGIFVHGNNPAAEGASMWNTGGMNTAFLEYDLGEAYNISGLYQWNYNEKPPYNERGLKNVKISVSDDGQTWKEVTSIVFKLASGKPEIPPEVIKFQAPVRGRYVRLDALSRYGSDAFGFSEIRFANADKAYVAASRVWTPKYTRPVHPQVALGQKLAGSVDNTFPAAANVVDVSKPPYNAKGDGVTDDTDAIQKALNDHPAQSAIIYLPNGKYLVSRQIRWGGGDDMFGQKAAKNTVMWGQSKEGTVIQLKDRCPGFNDPRTSRGVLWTGSAPAQRFANEIHNLTVDTGINNPGASGVQFLANNQGGIYDVNIISGDGQGKVGLDLGYTDEQGPMLAKNISVLGFDYGVSSATGVASWTGENITVKFPNKAGFKNSGQPASVRKFQFSGDVPAVQNGSGLLTLIDSTLVGTGAAKDLTAITINGGAALLRNVKTSGFKTALMDTTTKAQEAGPNIAEYCSIKPTTLLAGAEKTLNLPIKETPELPWGDSSTWAVPATNNAAGIQAAIDSGAETVLLPRATFNIEKTVVVRGNVKRIIGSKTMIDVRKPLLETKDPVFQIADGAADSVTLEGLHTTFANGLFCVIEHASKRTLILKTLSINFGAGQTPSHLTYRNTVPGAEVFIEDVVSGRWEFTGQQVWARQFNSEPTGPRLIVDGGTFWALGYKTERWGEIAVAKNGAKVEILGGLSQTSGSKQDAMFVNDNSDMSIFYSEVNNSEDPFAKFVIETKSSETKEFGDPNKRFKGWRPVIYEGRVSK
jgi:Pectate lyase superfamily protein/F5/8 type C domain